MAPEPSPAKSPRGAALALILATERLTAVHGSEQISLRQITEAAGVSNASAVQYHFGTREALLTATLRYRMADVNDCRNAYLRDLAEVGRTRDLRALVAAMVVPMAGQLAPRREGNFYVRFLDRVSHEGMGDILVSVARSMDGWTALDGLLRQALAELPQAVVDFRLRMMNKLSISGIAAIENSMEADAAFRSDVPLHLEMLVDAIMGMLAGSVSDETLGLLPAA